MNYENDILKTIIVSEKSKKINSSTNFSYSKAKTSTNNFKNDKRKYYSSQIKTTIE